MALTTRYVGEQIVIADDPSNMVFGTVMLGTTYGEVISCKLAREGDINKVKAAGSLLAVIISDPYFSLELECMFRDDITPPGLAEAVDFPLAGITGRVIPPIGISWGENDHRKLTIKVESWDAFGNEGSGSAYTFDGTTYTPIV